MDIEKALSRCGWKLYKYTKNLYKARNGKLFVEGKSPVEIYNKIFTVVNRRPE